MQLVLVFATPVKSKSHDHTVLGGCKASINWSLSDVL